MNINEPAPDFELPDLQGVPHKLGDTRGRIAIINFWSAECPHSGRTDQSLVCLLEKWSDEVVMLSIASNRNEPLQMIAEAAQARRAPTVLLDSEHRVADLYAAVTTPHVYVLDHEGILRYRGAVDNISFRHRKATRFFLKEAVEALLDEKIPELQETSPYGCSIVREI